MKSNVTIDAKTCKGCGLCAAACPKKIIRLDNDVLNAKGYHPASVFDMGQCTACAICAVICPDSAIKVEKEEG